MEARNKKTSDGENIKIIKKKEDTTKLLFEEESHPHSKLRELYKLCNKLEYGDLLAIRDKKTKVGIDSRLT